MSASARPAAAVAGPVARARAREVLKIGDRDLDAVLAGRAGLSPGARKKLRAALNRESTD